MLSRLRHLMKSLTSLRVVETISKNFYQEARSTLLGVSFIGYIWRMKFSRKTFDYFDQAHKNASKKEWFEHNRALYEDHVFAPFQYLIQRIDLELGDSLEEIEVSPRRICRPLRPSNKALEKGFVKDFISIDIAQKKSSLFEWNPGFHLQLGSLEDDNLIGGGLYMVSGRQIKRLREGFFHEYASVEKMMRKKDFIASWGEIKGERYKRFPKAYSQEHPSGNLIGFKQFYFSKSPKRSKVVGKNFIDDTIKDLRSSLELLSWLRETVGIYKK